MKPESQPVPTRCAIYNRVSSPGQESGTSLETQEAACRDYAVAQGYEIDPGQIYREVFSGLELWDRPQLTLLREAVRQRKIDVIVSHDIDRLSREPVHMGVILTEAEHHGVRVEFVLTPLDDSPEGQLIRFVRGYAAKVEHTKIRERSIRGRKARAEAGKPIPSSRPLFGYHWKDEAKSALLPHPVTAPIVKRIYDRCLEGASLRAIAEELHTAGIPTPNGSLRWGRTTVFSILNHPSYSGSPSAWRGTIPLSADAVPPLVPPEVAEAVHARLKLNKLRAIRNAHDPEAALLRGSFARCGLCGRSLVVVTVSKGMSYACRTDKWRCLCPSIRVHLLDEAVWNRVAAVLAEDGVIEREVSRLQQNDPTEADVAAVDAQLALTTRQRENLLKAVGVAQHAETITLLVGQADQLETRRQQLLAERQAVLNRRETWEAALANAHRLCEWRRAVASRLRTLSWREKRLALEALGIQVELFGEDHDPRYVITASIPFSTDNIVYKATRPSGPGIAI